MLATGTFAAYIRYMIAPNTIATFEAAMQRRLLQLPKQIRPFTTGWTDLPRAISLTGPRGVGKTTFLLYHSQNRKFLYLSADNPLIANESLYTLVKDIFMAGFEGVIIDEVHFAKDWSINLKAIYDDYPDRTIWISDSSSLILRSGVGDLSRRFLKIEMPLLSFREFLFLETGNTYPVYNPFAQGKKLPVSPTSGILEAFRKYGTTGTRPFYSENNFDERLIAVLDKSLYSDIPFFIPNVTDGNLRLMKAITAILAGSAIPRLKVNSLCADWGIGSDKLYQILAVMDSVGILRIIRIENDKKAKTAGAKLFFADPSFYPVLHGNTGTAREALVAMLCSNAGWTVEAARDETSGDFVLTKTDEEGLKKIMVEVGGASKKIKQADFVIRDDMDIPSMNAIPLWLLGMMY